MTKAMLNLQVLKVTPYKHTQFIANTTVEKLIIDNSPLSCEISQVLPAFVACNSMPKQED